MFRNLKHTDRNPIWSCLKLCRFQVNSFDGWHEKTDKMAVAYQFWVDIFALIHNGAWILQPAFLPVQSFFLRVMGSLGRFRDR